MSLINRNQAEFDHIKTLPENLPREQASKLIEAELKKLGVEPQLSTPPQVIEPQIDIQSIQKRLDEINEALKK